MVYWKIKFDLDTRKQFRKLDQHSQKTIQSYLNEKVLKLKHPKELGKPLCRDLKGKWRYRVDKFRIICKLEEETLVILVVKIAKRDVVYEN